MVTSFLVQSSPPLPYHQMVTLASKTNANNIEHSNNFNSSQADNTLQPPLETGWQASLLSEELNFFEPSHQFSQSVPMASHCQKQIIIWIVFFFSLLFLAPYWIFVQLYLHTQIFGMASNN